MSDDDRALAVSVRLIKLLKKVSELESRLPKIEDVRRMAQNSIDEISK